MIHVNVPLQISKSKGIFVCGEIIKMHTIHESNNAVIKLPSDGNSKVKKLWKHLMILHRPSIRSGVPRSGDARGECLIVYPPTTFYL